MPRLSVIIITKNEAENIRSCLESVRWADEIVIVDSGSSDGTQAICREFSDKIFVTDWPGFGTQKNRALAYASGEWHPPLVQLLWMRIAPRRMVARHCNSPISP
jgi:glycosyltransferase involved in cell wall biosynthesis